MSLSRSIHLSSPALLSRVGRISVWALLVVPALLQLLLHPLLSLDSNEMLDINNALCADQKGRTQFHLGVDAAPKAQESNKKPRFFNAKKQTDKAAKKTNEASKSDTKSAPSPSAGPTTKVNLDKLPAIESVFESLGLAHRMSHFVKAGFSETRHLLRITKMDINIIVSC